MNREIKFSRRAMAKFNNLLVFLEKEWSTKVKNDFILNLDKSLKQIQKFPESFPESEKIRGLRKFVMTKQTTIFYKYSDETINVITFFDNRQDPKSLFKETKD